MWMIHLTSILTIQEGRMPLLSPKSLLYFQDYFLPSFLFLPLDTRGILTSASLKEIPPNYYQLSGQEEIIFSSQSSQFIILTNENLPAWGFETFVFENSSIKSSQIASPSELLIHTPLYELRKTKTQTTFEDRVFYHPYSFLRAQQRRMPQESISTSI